MHEVTHVTSGQFDGEVLKSDLPVLVDFYAGWCGPCKMIAPHLEQLAGDLKGRAKVVKVNVDEEPSLAARYRITGVPTLLFFKGGAVVDTVVGLGSPQALKARLEALAPKPELVAA
ncbi:MAG: thioredoxin [Armatimonadetes bacterium CG_4_10_14_0_8_um_filter_66_14]|nr:thioredoxin [Armatimonadota bacterium]OIP09933.1 MAG: thioredoxin [Armatimonadetes bacterium CG2_30_66_41]PIU88704.1 MAG: thioredoxin [Armatimonadetes bacterium CG06_land_8_20_14_3_00_66_21]PIX49329.1 MAG: thioredoxin [Armatimonadetes bacterium CG_4_8_14_3_um_filter_66_20]PIZ49754.1 MAG: thioredoxin [Armatimonadetes bacterium CG_4_10_14_0_8_um_filter_66_14]PJB74905.1 MAG: thioredoxin [Armatimonadetes bacterium CG_4_9_14_3_um_filter_66_14]